MDQLRFLTTSPKFFTFYIFFLIQVSFDHGFVGFQVNSSILSREKGTIKFTPLLFFVFLISILIM
jgi:uncharacterized membrane protein (DUF485 family)